MAAFPFLMFFLFFFLSPREDVEFNFLYQPTAAAASEVDLFNVDKRNLTGWHLNYII